MSLKDAFKGIREAQAEPESITTQKSESIEVQPKKMGRPKAKRSNPDFMQVTALIRVDTHRAVWHKLLDDGREFSELMEELLSEWVRR